MAAAIARIAAESGLRTLACEMDAKGALAAAFGVPGPGFDPVEVAPRLWVMTMDTESSLREYLRVHLRLPFVARLGPLASTFDFVADAAPGVKEVLAVGKVCWEVRQNHYDLVVVDAEASGHVVSQIASPRIINSLVGRGPLGDQTRWMLEILDDASRCGVVIVASPEDMVVTESIDLLANLRSHTRTDAALVILNRCDPSPLGGDDEQVFRRLEALAAADPASVDAGVARGVRAVSALLDRHAESSSQARRLIDAVAPLEVVSVRTVVSPVRSEIEVVSGVADALREVLS